MVSIVISGNEVDFVEKLDSTVQNGADLGHTLARCGITVDDIA